MLRGITPTDTDKRLRFLMFGPAGVGKTTAAIQMPSPYIIDCEGGCVHYGADIAAKGGVVFETNDLGDIIQEVRSLMSERHSYRTLVIDPFTQAYEMELERGEREVGTQFGRHYGHAAKRCKELFRLLDLVDMNVVVTCHEKNEYGDNMKVERTTYDGWKRLDYRFDLVLELNRAGATTRSARVRKSRLPGFPDGDAFAWSFDELAARYDSEAMHAEPRQVRLATDEQLAEFTFCRDFLQTDHDEINRWLTKAGVEEISEFTEEQMGKCVALLQKRVEDAGGAF